MSSVTSFEAIEACASDISSLRDVKTRFESQAQLLLARANQAEDKIEEGEKILHVSTSILLINNYIVKNCEVTVR